MWNQVVSWRCSISVLIDHCLQPTDQSKKESGKGTDLIFKPNCYIYCSSSKIEELGKMLWPYLTELFRIKTLIFRENTWEIFNVVEYKSLVSGVHDHKSLSQVFKIALEMTTTSYLHSLCFLQALICLDCFIIPFLSFFNNSYKVTIVTL